MKICDRFCVGEGISKVFPEDVYRKLSAGGLPAFIPLQEARSTGFGNEKIRRIVEQAVGSDIFGEQSCNFPFFFSLITRKQKVLLPKSGPLVIGEGLQSKMYEVVRVFRRKSRW